MPTARITIKTIATVPKSVPGFSDDDDDESAPTVGDRVGDRVGDSVGAREGWHGLSHVKSS